MRDSAIEFAEEVDEWANRDLYFIDTDLIKEDIREFRKNPNEKEYKPLIYALVYTKGLHEFTKVYHSK